MKLLDRSGLWGLLLVGAGLLLLAQNLTPIALPWDLVWSPLLFALGVLLVADFARHTERWWNLIPGFLFLGLGTLVGLETVAPRLGDLLGGALVLGGLGAGFMAVYLAQRQNWWAVIPGGIMLTLAGVSVVDELGSGIDGGGLLFIGMGLTFGLLSVLPTPVGRMRWAIWPAGILLVMGALIGFDLSSLINFVWPLALIAAGAYVLLTARRES